MKYGPFTSFGNPWLPASIELNPQAYSHDPAARGLAELVSEEVEAEREAERALSKPMSPSSVRGLLGGPGDAPKYRCDSTPWFEYAVQPQVIERCALRLGVPAPELAETISRLLRPANWMTFYWYSKYLIQTDQTLAALQAGINRHQRADAAAVKRVRQEIGRGAGVKSGKARAKTVKLTPDRAAQERKRLREEGKPERSIVGIITKKFGYADSSSVRGLLREHDDKKGG
jgi:hypothetical protein